MEPGSESSQHQKRKPVTHGLEDQKRVSDKGGSVFCGNCCTKSKWQKSSLQPLPAAVAAGCTEPAVGLWPCLCVFKRVRLPLQAWSNVRSKELREGKNLRVLGSCWRRDWQCERSMLTCWVQSGCWFIVPWTGVLILLERLKNCFCGIWWWNGLTMLYACRYPRVPAVCVSLGVPDVTLTWAKPKSRVGCARCQLAEPVFCPRFAEALCVQRLLCTDRLDTVKLTKWSCRFGRIVAREQLGL